MPATTLRSATPMTLEMESSEEVAAAKAAVVGRVALQAAIVAVDREAGQTARHLVAP